MAIGCGGGEPATAPGPGAKGGGTATSDGQGGVALHKVGDFDSPLEVVQPPGEDHDLFVVEQNGRVIAVHDGESLGRPFLDLSDRVTFGGEQGLLSIAFAPDYPRSGLLYADYTDTAGNTQVVEYRRSARDPLRVDPKSARTVLTVRQPYANHNGGLVTFGPDGLLYVALGDGGSEGDPERTGQDLSTLLGKILRIDPRPSDGRPYSVPQDNPFVGQAAAKPEIWAYGLRNPWRFAFDRPSDSIAIGDVGGSEFEEVDLFPLSEAAGANFGWSAFEGDQRFNDDQPADQAVAPTLTYSHDDGCSITGGLVVRDRSLQSLYGRYLYGDFCSGELRSFTARPGRPAADDRALGLKVASLSSFGFDGAHRVYATSLEGPVYRLDPEQ